MLDFLKFEIKIYDLTSLKKAIMTNRINILVVIAVIVFTMIAKYIKPYESTINEYGFVAVGSIIIAACVLIFALELLINKLYLIYKKPT